MTGPLASALRHFFETLFPAQCLVCDATLSPPVEAVVCDPCLVELPWNRNACAVCAAPLASPPPHEQADGRLRCCPLCELRAPNFSRVVAPLRYQPPVPLLVHALKFRQHLPCGDWLAQTLIEALREDGLTGASAVIGVPMHPSRARQRGFNHAARLAQAVARDLGLLDFTGDLARVRATPAQSRLGAAARAHNLRKAFAWRGTGRAPRHVAIVDDVMTTGATASALTAALIEAGSEEVEIWCCARTPPRALQMNK